MSITGPCGHLVAAGSKRIAHLTAEFRGGHLPGPMSYTCRFGVSAYDPCSGRNNLTPSTLKFTANSLRYYVNMMIAWFFTTALMGLYTTLS